MNVPIDISGVTIRTARLLLRPWRESDLADFYAYASVDGVGQMAGWAPHESMEKSREILDRFIAGKKTFAIELDGHVVGSLGIEEYNAEKLTDLAPLRCRELGFVLAKEHWGKGLMPEAVRAVIDYLFREVGLDAITCAHYDWNLQSARVQEKCGFRPYREGTQESRIDGSLQHLKINLLRREEYLKNG